MENLVEILKNCSKGTKLYSPALGECALEGVIDSNDYPIKVTYKIINNDTRFDYFTKYGYLLINKPDAECMLFPSKDQRDWSKWQRPFVKGDILVSEKGNIVLCSHIDEEQVVHYHCILNFWGNLEIHNGTGVGYSYNCNLANDSQKQRLFDALKKEGYEWDAEKKELKTLQPFKDGDVVTCENQIAIFKKYICDYSGLAECYVFLNNNLEMDIDGHYYVKDLATEKEKAKLFKVLEDNGYKWNPETKTLEKLKKEKFNPKTLKPFESKVLVSNFGKWTPAIFGYYNKKYSNAVVVVGGNTYTKCIPYEGNEHLLSTNDEPSEFYRYWEE